LVHLENQDWQETQGREDHQDHQDYQALANLVWMACQGNQVFQVEGASQVPLVYLEIQACLVLANLDILALKGKKGMVVYQAPKALKVKRVTVVFLELLDHQGQVAFQDLQAQKGNMDHQENLECQARENLGFQAQQAHLVYLELVGPQVNLEYLVLLAHLAYQDLLLNLHLSGKSFLRQVLG
ncbi:hypothetical protein cypCar_00031617, partial [Cyprinus carpio]